MTEELKAHGPVVVGGVGGSGTRVVTEMLMDMGYFMGDARNSAGDNLWFRFLLKRDDWFERNREDHPEVIHEGLDLLTRILTGPFRPTPSEVRFILGAARDSGWRGFKRTFRLLRYRKDNFDPYVGWGWKVPSSHVYLDLLDKHFKNLKYIHLMRHGLDMAYSKTVGQLFDFGRFYGVEPPASKEDLPPAFLKYWVRANQQALALGARMGPERFLLMRFHELCDHPRDQIERLVTFLGLQPSAVDLERYVAIPKTPASAGRYKQHSLNVHHSADLSAVRELGFQVEM